MRRIVPLLVLFASSCFWPVLVEAKEVVEFADGRYLEIRSYVVRDDMIRIDVGRGSFMVIPVESVDEIRRDRALVFSQGREVPLEARSAKRSDAPDEGEPRRLEPSRLITAMTRNDG